MLIEGLSDQRGQFGPSMCKHEHFAKSTIQEWAIDHCGCYLLCTSVSRYHWRHFLEERASGQTTEGQALAVDNGASIHADIFLHFSPVACKAYAEMAEVCKDLRKESTQ